MLCQVEFVEFCVILTHSFEKLKVYPPNEGGDCHHCVGAHNCFLYAVSKQAVVVCQVRTFYLNFE